MFVESFLIANWEKKEFQCLALWGAGELRFIMQKTGLHAPACLPVGMVKNENFHFFTWPRKYSRTMDDTIFDCSTRSPEFGPINRLPQLPNSFKVMKAHEIDALMFAARSWLSLIKLFPHQLKKETTPVAPAFFQSVLFMAICQILLSHLMADIASWIQILVTLKLIRNGLKSFLKDNSYSNEPTFSQEMSCSLHVILPWKTNSDFSHMQLFVLGCHNVKFMVLTSLCGGQNLFALPKQKQSSNPHTLHFQRPWSMKICEDSDCVNLCIVKACDEHFL